MSNATDIPAGLEREYTLAQVASAIHRSTRWLRDRIAADGLEHTRHGNKITFTAAQVEALRELDKVAPTATPVTTGRKRS